MERIKKLYLNIKKDPDKFLLVLLVFALPFERFPSAEVLGVSVRTSVLVAAIIILRAIFLLITKRVKLNLALQEKILVFFVIWIVLLIPEAINLKRAFSVVVFNVFTILTALSVSVIFKKTYIKALLTSLFVSAVIVSVFGLLQYPADLFGLSPKLTGLLERYRTPVFGFPRIQALSLEPLYFASYLTLPIAAAISLLLLDAKKMFSPKLLWWLLLLFSTALALTLSRGGVLALVVVLVGILLASLLLKRFSIKKFGKVIAAIIIAFVIAYLTVNFVNESTVKLGWGKDQKGGTYATQIQNTGLDGGGDERATSRKRALLILSDNKSAWVVGVGPGQFGPYIQNNIPKEDDGGWLIVNNLTLELLVETGAVGLLAVVAFFVVLGYKLWIKTSKTKNNEEIVFMVIILAFLLAEAAQYQTFSTLYIVQIWTVAGFGMAMLRSSAKKPARKLK